MSEVMAEQGVAGLTAAVDPDKEGLFTPQEYFVLLAVFSSMNA